MTEQERREILIRARAFFQDTITTKHIENTSKCRYLSEFNVNPFLSLYLANFLTGNSDPESIAKALVYPRVLGTSITTSFGTHLQYFCSQVLAGFASAISGLDIEFVDQIDGRRKYCQIKSGPNTINKDDIATILGHFNAVRNLARTNRLPIQIDDLVVGVLYGTPEDLSTHYKRINESYPVIVGRDFWHRLTGSPDFYLDLINSIVSLVHDVDGTQLLEQVIQDLANEIRARGI